MSGCIEYSGCRTAAGYGLRRYNGKHQYTHRIAYAEANGLDVRDLRGFVMHSCDNRACINPLHLTLGTHLENMADMRSKGRQLQGADVYGSKLTDDAVLAIRARYVPRCRVNGQTAIARDYGVNQSVISRLLSGHNWKYLASHST